MTLITSWELFKLSRIAFHSEDPDISLKNPLKVEH